MTADERLVPPLPDSALDEFCETYDEARSLFRRTCSAQGAHLHAYTHPNALGPKGEALSVDVAVFGSPAASKALLVLSGTHGGEGYAGSAVQVAFANSGELARLPSGVRVVLVHGLNPYGFTHATRTTEHNVDLNRNFVDFSQPLPSNADYGEVHRLLCLREWSDLARATADADLNAWIEAHGQRAWLECIMKGQYDQPQGLNFGGHAPEWSNTTLHEIVSQHLGGVRQVGLIDWHTGLGAWAEPFFLCFNDRGGDGWQRACAWWGRDRIDTSDGYEGGERPPYNGLVFYGLQRMLGEARMTGAVIEFGTLPLKDAFDALRADNWLRFGDQGRDPAAMASLRAHVKHSFTPADTAWRHRVLAHAKEIHTQALQGVLAWV